MIGLIQRVTEAYVKVDGKLISHIDQGIMALIGIEKTDTEQSAQKLAQKLINYRIFSDHNNQMNLNVAQINGGILLVPQFTLAANTQKGLRPSFAEACPPKQAEILFSKLIEYTKINYDNVSSGIFGANMQVGLVNDGPVTFWLQI